MKRPGRMINKSELERQRQQEMQEMQMRRITSYQALWRPQDNKGHFWFTYFDGDRERSIDLDAESFRIILEILDTEKPIFGDHTTAAVAVHSEPTDVTVGAWA